MPLRAASRAAVEGEAEGRRGGAAAAGAGSLLSWIHGSGLSVNPPIPLTTTSLTITSPLMRSGESGEGTDRAGEYGLRGEGSGVSGRRTGEVGRLRRGGDGAFFGAGGGGGDGVASESMAAARGGADGAACGGDAASSSADSAPVTAIGEDDCAAVAAVAAAAARGEAVAAPRRSGRAALRLVADACGRPRSSALVAGSAGSPEKKNRGAVRGRRAYFSACCRRICAEIRTRRSAARDSCAASFASIAIRFSSSASAMALAAAA